MRLQSPEKGCPMNKNVSIITGAAGFLGSAITVALSRDHIITAIDIREPSKALLEAAPEVKWDQLDIADAKKVAGTFRRTKCEHGRIDFVIHLAAFYHFGTDWLQEYERTNVEGTANLLQAATTAGVPRFILASSIAAMEPPLPGQMLTEKTPTSDFTPYARSKAMGEEMIAKGADKLPGIVLRIGGVFSDWCELLPLYSLIRLWSGHGWLSRIVPGRGESGIPYIHRYDVVRIIKRCLEIHEKLDSFEIFLASHQDAVLHKELFPLIRQTAGERASMKPIFISPSFAKFGLFLRVVLGVIANDAPYERPWMLEFVDRPWVTDVSHTQNRLGWSCSPGMGILERLPIILHRFKERRSTWIERNKRRNIGRYAYSF